MIAECWKSSSVLLNGGAEELFSILGNFCGKGLEGEIKIDLSGFCDSLPLFQFTHLHEVRPIFQSGDCKLFEFQFTHLHEVRRFALFCAMSDDTFQFTHLHEVRLSRLIRLLQAPIFQFTHLHEVRPRFL